MLHLRLTTCADHHPAAAAQCLEILRGHGGPVRTLVHANGMLFSGSYDKTVRVWDTETLECRATLTGHSGAVRALVSSPQYVFSGSDDTTIKVSHGAAGLCVCVCGPGAACSSQGQQEGSSGSCWLVECHG